MLCTELVEIILRGDGLLSRADKEHGIDTSLIYVVCHLRTYDRDVTQD